MSISTEAETRLAAQIEALLFVATEPVSVAELAATLELEPKAIELGIAELEADLQTSWPPTAKTRHTRTADDGASACGKGRAFPWTGSASRIWGGRGSRPWQSSPTISRSRVRRSIRYAGSILTAF